MVKEATSLKLDSKVMERVKKEAEYENRSVNNYIETILIKHFRDLDQKKEKPESE